jgi:hypothetical protein
MTAAEVIIKLLPKSTAPTKELMDSMFLLELAQ